ncbi:MAG: type secretion system protein GspG [Verrucomicrobiota bacterium]|jgi:general secretion pathway protein G
MKTPRSRRHAFSLVELVIVIGIMATLAAIVGVNVMKQAAVAKVGEAKAQMSQLKQGVSLFYSKHSRLPEKLDDLVINPGNVKNWVACMDNQSIPKDPWGNDYIYESKSSNNLGYEITSLGADGAPGGDELDADLKLSER